MKDFYEVKSLAKAFRVLESFQKKEILGISEISAELNIPKSTVYNIIYTLEKLGYVKKIDQINKFKLDTGILELSQFVELDLRSVAKPYLEQINKEVNETVNLVIRQGTEVLYLEIIESTEHINISTEVGKKQEIYCTAVGKVILAYLNQETRNNILEEIDLEARGPNTITSISNLKKKIVEIRDKGYAIDNEEFSKGVKCIAAPIFDHFGKPKAALSISGPVDRMGANVEEYYSKLVIDYAHEISSQIGYNKNFTTYD